MNYLCLIHHVESELAAMPKAEAEAFRGEYIAFTRATIDAGQQIVSEALQPAHTATTVRISNGTVTATEGPFAETREQIGGFFLIEARDLNEAVAIAARIPSARTGGVEVRPVIDFSQPG